MKRFLLSMALLTGTLIAPASFASPSSEALNACETRMAEAARVRFPGLIYDFRSMRGSTTKRLSYRVRWEGARGTTECRARRREILDLVWPEAFLEMEASRRSDATTEEEAMSKAISADFPYEKKRIEVNGSTMAYVDEGQGPVVLFLHGNPTSSYLWRNILPYAEGEHRVIAPDLIGMGDSAKPDIDYTFADHVRYLDGFITALSLDDVTLVVHDWGSALGMRHARLNPDTVRGLAFMEAIIPPSLPAPSLEAMGAPSADLFGNLRTPGVGEEMVLANNFFVEVVLPEFGVVRALTDAEMAEYRRPYPTPESRKPTLVWPRQIPIAGEPADVTAEVTANGAWLYSSPMPKLFFHATPGALLPPPAADYVIANATNLTAVDIGAGTHFLQEDNPHAIGEALAAWLATLPD